MRFAQIHEHLYCRPWFITPSAHFTLRELFEAHVTRHGAGPDSGRVALALADMVNPRRPMVVDQQGIATIHILGPLGKNLSKMEKSCGATSFEDIQSELAQAEANPAVRGIILHVDSPGGTVQGTPETASAIAAATKPLVAYTEDMMASAAYYLSAGADRIVASPSADVGSIGVYIPWVDRSAQNEASGLRPDPIINTGGDLKATGFGGVLTETQRTFLQESVDRDFAAFRQHIADHRAVDSSALRGQLLSGRPALEANLVDAVGSIATARSLLLASFV
jgi:signal peptide peptidase SppA